MIGSSAILFLVEWIVIGGLVAAASAAVYRKAGFDDWGNYAAFVPFLIPLLLIFPLAFEATHRLGMLLAAVLVPLSLSGNLLLLAVRRWPSENPDLEGRK